MWPEIQAALATGKKLKEVWEADRRDSLHISYPHFRVYVSRLRRRERAWTDRLPQLDQRPQSAQASNGGPPSCKPPADPLYNVRVMLEKKRQSHFECNPFPNPEDHIT